MSSQLHCTKYADELKPPPASNHTDQGKQHNVPPNKISGRLYVLAAVRTVDVYHWRNGEIYQKALAMSHHNHRFHSNEPPPINVHVL